MLDAFDLRLAPRVEPGISAQNRAPQFARFFDRDPKFFCEAGIRLAVHEAERENF